MAAARLATLAAKTSGVQPLATVNSRSAEIGSSSVLNRFCRFHHPTRIEPMSMLLVAGVNACRTIAFDRAPAQTASDRLAPRSQRSRARQRLARVERDRDRIG